MPFRMGGYHPPAIFLRLQLFFIGDGVLDVPAAPARKRSAPRRFRIGLPFCHCEPVRTLAWQSVPLASNILNLTANCVPLLSSCAERTPLCHSERSEAESKDLGTAVKSLLSTRF